MKSWTPVVLLVFGLMGVGYLQIHGVFSRDLFYLAMSKIEALSVRSDADETPKCSDPQVLKLVSQIVLKRNQFTSTMGFMTALGRNKSGETANPYDVALSSIRMTNVDPTTGRKICAADYSITITDDSKGRVEVPKIYGSTIAYSVQATEDNKIYVAAVDDEESLARRRAAERWEQERQLRQMQQLERLRREQD